MKGSEFCFCFWYTLWPQRTYLISKAFIFCDLYSRRMALQCLLTTAVAVSCICLLASAHRNLIPCHCRRRVLSVCSFLYPIQRGFLGCRKTDCYQSKNTTGFKLLPLRLWQALAPNVRDARLWKFCLPHFLVREYGGPYCFFSFRVWDSEIQFGASYLCCK